MTDTYLRSLGFASTSRATRTSRASFDQSWRYQYDHEARDGATLFIEHPLGIDICRLSAHAAPLSAEDIFASVSLHDLPAFERAMKAFYVAHGGMGAAITTASESAFRPFHRAV